MPQINRQLVLASRPQGAVTPDNFRLVETPLAPLADGEFRVRNHFLSLDPYMRGRMNDSKSYAAPQPLNEVMIGGTVGEVVESKNPKFAVGDKVVAMFGWQEYGTSNGCGRAESRRHARAAVGVSRPGRHARRDGVVRPEQDHRAESG